MSAPVSIADGITWVGMRLPDDQFQCHAYLIDAGEQSVLVDPGSPLTIESTLDLVAQVMPLEDIAYLVCHHADPDIAASLPYLSDRLSRRDVTVVTEWRAAALLKHYGHRFDYYLVEDHEWALPLGGGRRLEFQLTPYLHFPGAFVSYDPATRTLFSSDLFGGFVPDTDVLVSDDVGYIVESARPFHQHYMPSRELLVAGLTRIQQRWPDIERIAPQHGHVIPRHAIAPVMEALKQIDCGVFTLAEADMDLKRLVHLAEARTQITEALLTIAEPRALVTSINAILRETDATMDVSLFIDLPDTGWTMWGLGNAKHVHRTPPPAWPTIDLPGEPAALLAVRPDGGTGEDADLTDMLSGLAPLVRPAVDQYLHDFKQTRRVADLRRAAMTDPLTGLGNRRALAARMPVGTYSVISADLDHFKSVNDEFGHAAGDSVLAQVASVMADAVRQEDAVYRVGGEEFLVVLPEADEASVRQVAERIRSAVARLDLDGQAPGGRVSLSMGITTTSGQDAAALARAVEVADAALYRSKEDGRDRVTALPTPVPAA